MGFIKLLKNNKFLNAMTSISLLFLLGIIVFTLTDYLIIALRHYSHPTLYNDSWELIKIPNGHQELLEWIISKHNEHRILFLRISSILESRVFGIIPGQTSLLQILLLILGCSGLWLQLCRKLAKSKTIIFGFWIIGSILIFHPWQLQNLSWEFQVPWFFINFLVFISCNILLKNPSNKNLINKTIYYTSCVLIPWASIYSTGQGIALSIAFSISSLLKSKKQFWITSLSSVLVLLLYFLSSNQNQAIDLNTIGYELDIISIPFFLSTLLGGPLLLSINSFIFILIVLAIFILIKDKKVLLEEVKSRIFALGPFLNFLFLFPVIFSLMLTLSRRSLGLQWSFASRYTTHSIIFSLFLLSLCVIVFDTKWGVKSNQIDILITFQAILTAFIALVIFAIPNNLISALTNYLIPSKITNQSIISKERLIKFKKNIIKHSISYFSAWDQIKEIQETRINSMRLHAKVSQQSQNRDEHIEEFKDKPYNEFNTRLYSDQGLIYDYFQGKLEVKPKSWHKNLIQSIKKKRNNKI